MAKRTTLSAAQRTEIKKLYRGGKGTTRAGLAEQFHVSAGTIRNIVTPTKGMTKTKDDLWVPIALLPFVKMVNGNLCAPHALVTRFYG